MITRFFLAAVDLLLRTVEQAVTAIVALMWDGTGVKDVYFVVIEFLAIYDMTVLCFYSPKEDDARLDFDMAALLPIAYTMGWSMILLTHRLWQPDGWAAELSDASNSTGRGVEIWIRMMGYLLNFAADPHALSTSAVFLCGLYYYTSSVLILAVVISACVSVVLEHTKTSPLPHALLGDRNQVAVLL